MVGNRLHLRQHCLIRLERWFACSRPLLEAKSYGIKVKSKTVHTMAKHILKREQGRIGINRFQSTGGNDNAARIRSKRRSRNLCKMPDKEDAALVLPRSQRPYVSTSETYYKENSINPPQPAKRLRSEFLPSSFPSSFHFLYCSNPPIMRPTIRRISLSSSQPPF